jgi:hypothetical protein
MTIELIELLACPILVFLAVALTVKLIQRQGDVLYGPYIQGRKTSLAQLRDRLDAFTAKTGLKRKYGRFAMKFATASIFASAVIG